MLHKAGWRRPEGDRGWQWFPVATLDTSGFTVRTGEPAQPEWEGFQPDVYPDAFTRARHAALAVLTDPTRGRK